MKDGYELEFPDGKKAPLEDVITELFEYLTEGKIPGGIVGLKSPKLSPRMAWGVIWMLQVHYGFIPDNIERCDECGNIYNAWSGGCCCQDAQDCKDHGLNAKAKNKFLCGSCMENLAKYQRRDLP